jgi:hypothetical protein
METLLEADFSGPLPIATLNCFKAYKMCLEVWKIISLHYMAADGSGVPLEFADFADLERDAYVRNIHSSSFYHLTSASIVDKMMKTAKKGKVDFSEMGALRVMGNAIVEVWGKSGVEEFVWKGV